MYAFEFMVDGGYGEEDQIVIHADTVKEAWGIWACEYLERFDNLMSVRVNSSRAL